MSKTLYKLTQEQRAEHKRLTQFANRRIMAFTKEYEKKGLEIIPHSVSGGIQTRDQWHSEKMPMSRSIKFASEKAFKEHMRFLKTFENPTIRENVTDYTKSQRTKTLLAVQTATGSITKEEVDLINDLGTADLAKFWQKFSEIAARMSVEYSSDEVMSATIEFFKEDRRSVTRRAKERM